MSDSDLIEIAAKAGEGAYAPYSRFSVGAALLAADGKIFTGCNIENKSYSPTVCAERTAFFKAVSEGERAFSAIAVYGGKNPCAPCGVCRQVMSEFCGGDFRIILSDGSGGTVSYTLADLMPHSFELK